MEENRFQTIYMKRGYEVLLWSYYGLEAWSYYGLELLKRSQLFYTTTSK